MESKDLKNIENIKEMSKVKPLLIEFMAPWCKFCDRLNPVVSEVIEEYGDKLDIVRVNIDDEKSLAVECEIVTIPAFLLFADGEKKGELVNPPSKVAILKWLEAEGF
ncbi:MAG: thioredoxin family protein [Anaerovoracaceae bacterium]